MNNCDCDTSTATSSTINSKKNYIFEIVRMKKMTPTNTVQTIN